MSMKICNHRFLISHWTQDIYEQRLLTVSLLKTLFVWTVGVLCHSFPIWKACIPIHTVCDSSERQKISDTLNFKHILQLPCMPCKPHGKCYTCHLNCHPQKTVIHCRELFVCIKTASQTESDLPTTKLRQENHKLRAYLGLSNNHLRTSWGVTPWQRSSCLVA